MVVGTGIDIVEIERIRAAKERWGERFLSRVFTRLERAHCARRKEEDSSLAARFAAKEAVAKALGLGLGRFAWQEIEVVTLDTGRPLVRMTGLTLAAAQVQGVGRVLLSLSHTRQYAVAQAVALSVAEQKNRP
ncbi:MAG: holo-ACP synthase [Firmicutes bacterium]|nr:holo-ACP synthase [Bacillota bacterium]